MVINLTQNRLPKIRKFTLLTGAAFAIFGSVALELCKAVSASNLNEARASLQSVVPGPLEDSRKLLLAEIEDANKKGVGTKTYMALFRDLEVMVKNGEPERNIESDLKKIREALKEQLLDQPANPWTTTNPSARLTKPYAYLNSKIMPLAQARAFVLELVNKERAIHRLAPLVMDSIANAAAQMHSDEMARMGCVAHLDSRGRTPDQRYTELGGTHNVGENIASYSLVNHNGNPNELHNVKGYQFSAARLSKLEADFMNEKPPDNLHRLQTLSPEHNRLGVGLSYSENSNGQWCLVLDQEFIDQYGEYSKIPQKIVPGTAFKVSGSLNAGVILNSISIRWDPEPRPLTKEELIKSSHEYGLPEISVENYFSESNKAIKLWNQNGHQHFSLRVVPNYRWKPGLYYIVIDAVKKNHVITVSSRTTHL